MKTKSGHMTIAEICEQIESKSLVANRVYQRAAGLWPESAQRYFIDTIINDYPFQSVYLHEYVQPKTRKVRKDSSESIFLVWLADLRTMAFEMCQ